MKRTWFFLLLAPLVAAQEVPDLYIVRLSGPPAAAVAAKGRAPAAVVDRRAQIRREQDAVRAGLRGAGAEVVDSVSTVANALVVRAPGMRREDLEAMPGVSKVYPVRRYKLMLDHALPLHKVPGAWEALGGKDNAGAGMKIAIIDTGIDLNHAAFKDPSISMPPGFPRVNKDSDAPFTNTKVIVARSYSFEDPSDLYGHGTAGAMAAAGATNTGPYGEITGVAPKAYIGNYKVTEGIAGSTTNAIIMRAFDDAVADGMDVINLSFGDSAASRPEDDPLVDAIEMAAASGVIVAVSAGNEGPDPETIASPATAASAIAVGASENDRTFGRTAVVDGAPPYLAVPPVEQDLTEPVTGPLFDVSQIDQDGLACNPFPADSLKGKVAFILRGSCAFSAKLDNAQAAGAAAALLYTHANAPEVVDLFWTVGSSSLPAEIVSNADGLDIKKRLEENAGLAVTLNFRIGPVFVNPNTMVDFSSRGPNVNQTIKPDLLAVGTLVYTATQTTDSSGDLFDPSGYIVVNGTSFSSPIVAGAAALVKQARPGLNVQQYRSLLINGASQWTPAGTDRPAPAQWTGAGVLNVADALRGTVAAYPTSLSFGWGGGTVEISRDLNLTNVGPADDTYAITVVPAGDGPAPSLSSDSVQLAAGASERITLRFSGSDLAAAEYQGYIEVKGTDSQVSAHIPYWYGAASGTPKHLTLLQWPDSGAIGSTQSIYFRVTDTVGVPLQVSSYTPEVTVVSGDGDVIGVNSVDFDVPDAYRVRVHLGMRSGTNVYQIKVGDLTATVHIVGSGFAHP